MTGLRHLLTLLSLAASASPLDAGKTVRVTADGELRTLEQARDAARGVDGPVTIEIAEGTYYLNESLALDARDSSTTWAPAAGAAVVIRGSAVVPAAKTSPIVVSIGKHRDVYALFQGDTLLVPAREPDYADGYAQVPGKPVAFWEDRRDDSQIRFSVGDLPVSGELRGPVEANVFPRYNYWNELIPVRSISDGSVTLSWETSFPIRPGDRFFLQGAARFLDRPGEWFYHPETGDFRILPAIPDAPVHVAVIDALVRIEGARDIAFHNIGFEHGGESAIHARDVAGLKIVGTTIRRFGGGFETAAIDVTGSGAIISENTIENVGGHGVFVVGDKMIVEDNTVRNFGTHFKQGAGIRIDGSGHRAAHNLIENGPRWGIGFHGRGHTIELNRIRNVSLETSDTAAIYGGAHGDPKNGGHLIRFNVISDVPGIALDLESGRYVSPATASGIYLDDGMSNCTVTGNVVARTSLGGGFNHGGVSNTWTGNIFVDGTERQMTFDQWDSLPGSNRFDGNVVAYTSPDAVYLKMSEGAVIESDRNVVHAPDNLPKLRIGFDIVAWSAWQASGHDRSTELANPELLEGFRFAPSSPALRAGFDPPPVATAGPR